MMLFINKMFLLLQFEDKILHENVHFQPLFVVVKPKQRMDLLHSIIIVIYLLYNSK